MTAEQGALFCVWAGEGGKYADAFVKGEYIAIGWPEVRDLHRVESYDELRARLREAYPDERPGRVRNYLGQISNFILRIKIGDYVVTPSSDSSWVCIGEVISHPFKVLNLDESSPYPHRRKVEWLSRVWRSDLSESTQRSLRSPQAIFRIDWPGAWNESVVGSPLTLEKENEWNDSRVPTLVRAEPRDGYRIWLRFDDGLCGEVDLSGTPRTGVLAAWEDRAFFETAHLDEHGAVVWGEDEQVDACPGYLYSWMKGTCSGSTATRTNAARTKWVT